MDPTEYTVLWTIRVNIPNGIMIGSAVFALGLMIVTDRPTDHAPSVMIGLIYAVLRCGLKIEKIGSSTTFR